MNGEKYSFTHAWQPLAATCSHSSGRKWPPAFSCHRQPLAATCSHSSGRKWPQVAASILLSPAATCSHSSGRKWPQVAARASGRKWPQVAARASGRKWPPLPESNSCPSARSLVNYILYTIYHAPYTTFHQLVDIKPWQPMAALESSHENHRMVGSYPLVN